MHRRRGRSTSLTSGLYDPSDHHDACGVALIVDISGHASHEVLARGLAALGRLTHRGAVDERGHSVDGAGVLTGIPWALLARELPSDFHDSAAHRVAAMCFLPPAAADRAARAAERAFVECGWISPHWRTVPVNARVLPPRARPAPLVVQAFAVAGPGAKSPYRTRLAIEAAWRRERLDDCAVVSLSDRTIAYKALAAPHQVPQFFRDLTDPLFRTPFVVAHQRFSTNTLPRWDLAQPFRTIAHNGEINTIRGNRLWMAARLADPEALPPLGVAGAMPVRTTGSDSQTLDDAIELMREVGLTTPEALARLFPYAWERDAELSDDVRAFHQYQSCFAEPWEGPAAIVFADGRHAGALVDRNGFRPMRTVETSDGLVCAGSEAGLFDLTPDRVIRRGRLGPGELLLVDLDAHAVVRGADAWRDLAGRDDYQARAAEALRHPDVPSAGSAPSVDVAREHRRFGWTREELDLIVRPIACEGHEAVGSMGDDTPIAPLASRARPLSDYFRQRFAQVTNPPVDPFRESIVMSLRTLVGRRGSWVPGAGAPTMMELESPVLTEDAFAGLAGHDALPSVTFSLGFDAAARRDGLRRAVDALRDAACDRVAAGCSIVILSDRRLPEEDARIPTVLAVAAVDQALRGRGLRLRASVVVETGEARDAHQVAVLCAFGASAVLPYLLYATGAQLGGDEGPARCRAALEQGLLKILSKMGVCTFEAYTGSWLFDPLGVDQGLLDEYFGGLFSPLGGIAFDDLADDVLAAHEAAAQSPDAPLAHPGFHTFRKGGDHHAFNPVLVKRLHQAASDEGEGSYRAFAELAAARPPSAVRDLLDFKACSPVPLAEVEPVDAICRTFFASAMSVGALGPEAHRALAVAMNMLGARSNSGEGGEEGDRLGRAAGSATKQVASARFGVTPAYLMSASELQIKIAQGSKPGEGGQLPGVKVNDLIARLRHAQPGMTLVSPPPHHDIYSIEDLAQLIYDLRAFHPAARINVKLVAQPGIGVIAVGVVKAGADAIQISGHSGGTGASPRGSIKHAGAPWEIGLAEAHHALVACALRDRVVLQTDGGLQTGRDLAVAAALGAQEYGFGTALLTAMGCVMARQCHQNTCPVGIATQRPELRARFAGSPDMVVRYLRLVAEDLRRILATLGLRRIGDLVGRADLLTPRPKTGRGTLDVAPLLVHAPMPPARQVRRRVGRGATLNTVLARTTRGRVGHVPVSIVAAVRNTDRAVGAPLAGELAAQYGDAGTAHTPIELRLTGTAGQSLWAFALPGMHVRLVGEANDGVGKGMHGGEIVIRPPASHAAEPPVLVGNAALYGATGGRVFIAGRAGERFGVRNSGAWAAVEGVGDHGCEYMTGGAVLILGQTGRNFAAGMTGGVAYVLDEGNTLASRINEETVTLHRGLGAAESWVRAWLVEHRERTGSVLAADLLRRWPTCRDAFRTVSPRAAAVESAIDRIEVPAAAEAVAVRLHHR